MLLGALLAALITLLAPAGNPTPAGATPLIRYQFASAISANIEGHSTAERIAADAASELAAVQSAASRADVTSARTQTAVGTVTPTAQAPAALPFAAGAAAPAPTSTVVVSSIASPLRQALAASIWPAALWPTVERIVACESSGHPGAVSPGGHVGVMQVDPALWGPVPADIPGQLEQAYRVYLAQGWGAWSCY